MNVLQKIRAAGFELSLVGEEVEISPVSKLTANQWKFLKSHKAEIIEELSTFQKITDWLTTS